MVASGSATWDGDKTILAPSPNTLVCVNLGAPPPFLDISIQTCIIFPKPWKPNDVVDFALERADGKMVKVLFFGNGEVRVTTFVGDSPVVWAGEHGKAPGTKHIIHLNVDPAGFPSLFNDCIPIPLTPAAMAAPIPPLFEEALQLPTLNRKCLSYGAFPGPAGDVFFDYFVVHQGVVHCTSCFVCPAGPPATTTEDALA